jgi:hypothetical protein
MGSTALGVFFIEGGRRGSYNRWRTTGSCRSRRRVGGRRGPASTVYTRATIEARPPHRVLSGDGAWGRGSGHGAGGGERGRRKQRGEQRNLACLLLFTTARAEAMQARRTEEDFLGAGEARSCWRRMLFRSTKVAGPLLYAPFFRMRER